jgi:hypothetical protein
MAETPGAAVALFGGVKAYARHRKSAGLTGGSPAAVRKADDRGDVVWLRSGEIDFAATDARWGSDAVQEAWREEGEPQGGTAEPVPPTTARSGEGRRRPAAPPEAPTAVVLPRQQDATSNRLKESRANREEVEARRRLRLLQVEEGELMRADEGTALMLEVVGRICDRMDAVPDVVTEDLVSMFAEWLERARTGEVVEVDTAVIHASISEAVRSAREGVAGMIEKMRAEVLSETAPA